MHHSQSFLVNNLSRIISCSPMQDLHGSNDRVTGRGRYMATDCCPGNNHHILKYQYASDAPPVHASRPYAILLLQPFFTKRVDKVSITEKSDHLSWSTLLSNLAHTQPLNTTINTELRAWIWSCPISNGLVHGNQPRSVRLSGTMLQHLLPMTLVCGIWPQQQE